MAVFCWTGLSKIGIDLLELADVKRVTQKLGNHPMDKRDSGSFLSCNFPRASNLR